jgi:hypothetical protein
VLRFSGAGSILTAWGELGVDTASMHHPTGIVVDGLGNVLVVDSSNHRVMKFAPIQ